MSQGRRTALRTLAFLSVPAALIGASCALYFETASLTSAFPSQLSSTWSAQRVLQVIITESELAVEAAESVALVVFWLFAVRVVHWRAFDWRPALGSRSRLALGMLSISAAAYGAFRFTWLALVHLIVYSGFFEFASGIFGAPVAKSLKAQSIEVNWNLGSTPALGMMEFELLLVVLAGGVGLFLCMKKGLWDSVKYSTALICLPLAFGYEVLLWRFDPWEMGIMASFATPWELGGLSLLSNYFLLAFPVAVWAAMLVTSSAFKRMPSRFLLTLASASLAFLLISAAFAFSSTGWHQGTVSAADPIQVISLSNFQPHAGYDVTVAFGGSTAHQVVDNMSQVNRTVFCFESFLLWGLSCYGNSAEGTTLLVLHNGTGTG